MSPRQSSCDVREATVQNFEDNTSYCIIEWNDFERYVELGEGWELKPEEF